MERLEVSGAVRPIYGSLGVKRLIRHRGNMNVSQRYNSGRNGYCRRWVLVKESRLTDGSKQRMKNRTI